MRWLAVLALVAGCGRFWNQGPATIIPPQGGYVDGTPGPATVDKRQPHEVVYPDGRRCIVDSSAAARYVLGDIFFTVLIGLLYDVPGGYLDRLDEDGCPGVLVRN